MVVWSRRGWLTLVIGLFSLVLALRLSMASEDGWTRVLLFELGLLVGAGANQLLAVALNSVKTPQGRRWHQAHTLYDVSIQGHTGTFLALILIVLAVAVGRLIAPLAGWGVAAGGVALAVTGALVYRRRRRARRAAQRASAAGQRQAPGFDQAMNEFFSPGGSGQAGSGGTASPGSPAGAPGQPAGDLRDVMSAFFGGNPDGQPRAARRAGNKRRGRPDG